MKTRIQGIRGITLVQVVIGLVLLAIVALGCVEFVSAVQTHETEQMTQVQENSYRVLQNEIALSGSSPAGMASNPLASVALSTVPMPAVTQNTSAGSAHAGSATISAYVAAPDLAGRSGSLGFRIAATGTAIPPPAALPLGSPSFSYAGAVPPAAFTPNLYGLILPNLSNPAGTVYRYTTDGSTPTSSSPIWSPTSFFTIGTLPSTLEAAAFNSDPDYSTSAVAIDVLTLSLPIVYGRAGGGTGDSGTGFHYSDVAGGTDGILLSIPNAPVGTAIYYTYDGSVPTAASVPYTGAFQVPLAAWGSTVTLRAMGVIGGGIATVTPATVTLTPIQVALAAPTFGTPTGVMGPVSLIAPVSLPVSDLVPGVMIEYSVNNPVVVGTSPSTVGGIATITAP